jgi:hypothetical protein
VSAQVHDRITIEPDKMDGQPCIRGVRFPVGTVLRMVAGGDHKVGPCPRREAGCRPCHWRSGCSDNKPAGWPGVPKIRVS